MQVSSLNRVPVTHGCELCTKYYCMGWRLYYSQLALLAQNNQVGSRGKLLGTFTCPKHSITAKRFYFTPATYELEQQRHMVSPGSAMELVASKLVVIKCLGLCHQG